MRAKTINENGGYPPGAEYDKNAPWNEPEDHSEVEVKDEGGSIDIITTVQTGEDDWEETDRQEIDPSDLNEYLADKLNLEFPKIEDEEGIEVKNIEELENKDYEFTVMVKVTIPLSDLYDIAEKSRKRRAKYYKKPTSIYKKPAED